MAAVGGASVEVNCPMTAGGLRAARNIVSLAFGTNCKSKGRTARDGVKEGEER